MVNANVWLKLELIFKISVTFMQDTLLCSIYSIPQSTLTCKSESMQVTFIFCKKKITTIQYVNKTMPGFQNYVVPLEFRNIIESMHRSITRFLKILLYPMGACQVKRLHLKCKRI